MLQSFSQTVCLLLAIGSCAGAEYPYGHPQFYPSAERPLGWLGDGTGSYPGAEPVTTFDSRKGQDGQNIVWKIPMPSPSFAAPLVVGEKVFVLADPNILLCLDIHSGDILWQDVVHHADGIADRGLAERTRRAMEEVEAEALAYGRWRQDLNAVFAKLREHGLKDDKLLHGKLKYGEGELKEPGHPGFAKAMADADFKRLWQSVVERERGKGYEFGFGGNSRQIDRDHWKGWRRQMLVEHSLYTFSQWYGWLTATYCTPVTDGESVYVTFTQHQTACYDLDGNRRWLTWNPPEWKKYNPDPRLAMGTRFTKAPVLFRDKLLVRNDSVITAFDKASGRIAWSHPLRTRKGRYFPPRPEPEATQLGTISIPVEGTDHTLDIVADPSGKLYRLEDGKPLAEWFHSCNHGTVIARGDLLFGCGEVIKDRPGGGGYVYRLTAKNRDSVHAELLWHRKDIKLTNLPLEGNLLAMNLKRRPPELIDFASGATLHKNFHRKAGTGKYSWVTRAGEWIVGFDTVGYGPGTHPHKDDEGTVNFTFYGLSDGSRNSAGRIQDRRYIDDPDFAARWLYRGSMNFVNNAAPSFHANRMFFRTPGYVWCIGDPRTPMPIPRDLPAEARVR